MGTKVGGSPTGKMDWPTPQQKTGRFADKTPMSQSKSIAKTDHKDNFGGYPKGKLRGKVGGIS